MRETDPRATEDQIIDRYLDGDLLPDESCDLFESLRRDPARSRELFAMQRAIQALGEPVASPDLTRPILAAVGRRRGLLSPPARRMVTVGRVAAAACVMLAFAGVYTIHRLAPRAASPGMAQSRVIEDIESGMQNEVPEVIDNLQHRLGEGIAQIQPPKSGGGAEVIVEGGELDALALGFSSADVDPGTFSAEMDPLVTRTLMAQGVAPVERDRALAGTGEGVREVGQPFSGESLADRFPQRETIDFRPSFGTDPLSRGMPGVMQRPDGTVMLIDAARVLEQPSPRVRKPSKRASSKED